MKPCHFLACLAVFASLGAAPALANSFGSRAVPDRAVPTTARVTISLPLRNEAELDALIRLQSDSKSPQYHHYLSRAQFRARYGPDVATFRAVIAAIRAHGLRVDDVASQSLHASGSASAIAAAFGTTLSARRFAGERSARLVATSPIHLDATLARAGARLTGLQGIPPFHADSARATTPLNRYSNTGPYWFTDLKEAYAYPSFKAATGKGATIGIVISNDILDSDLAAYFNHEKFTTISGKPVPTIVRRPVDNGAPFDPNLSFESSLDVQQSLGSAPGANLVLYNLPDLSNQSVTDGYTAVVEDNIADVISSSFGLCELYYTAAYNGGQDFTSIVTAERAIFKQGNAQGQTFVASSGDNAGLPCASLDYFNGLASSYVPSVSDPASDPNVTAVGGTNLVTTTPPSPQPSPPVLASRYVRESEFADAFPPSDPYGTGGSLSNGYFGSGSGTSVFWKKPLEQYFVGIEGKMRAVPDISMQMGGCPFGAVQPCGADDSAAYVVDGGSLYGVVGTSVSSPEFAGLLAVEVGSYGQRLGNVNPLLYGIAIANVFSPVPLLHTSIPGYNGVVTVSKKPRLYNPIVGVGTPVAENFLGLPFAARAGDPKTPTNP